MNLVRKRWAWRLALVLLVAVAVFFWYESEGSRNLTIENRSNRSVAELDITISGQTSTFHNIKAGDVVTAKGPLHGDERFSVEGRLSDGARVRAYGRAGESLRFLLLPDGTLQEPPKGQR